MIGWVSGRIAETPVGRPADSEPGCQERHEAERDLGELGESTAGEHMREQIVAAAIPLADAEGLEAVTMRRLAAEVGLGTMTLYHYVAGRQELEYLVRRRDHGRAARSG